jgi:hypothetical protein
MDLNLTKQEKEGEHSVKIRPQTKSNKKVIKKEIKETHGNI